MRKPRGCCGACWNSPQKPGFLPQPRICPHPSPLPEGEGTRIPAPLSRGRGVGGEGNSSLSLAIFLIDDFYGIREPLPSMDTHLQPDYTQALRSQMQPIGISSFKALSRLAGVSVHQIGLIRQGAIARVRLETLLKLSQALEIEIGDLLETLGAVPQRPTPASSASLQQEYDRLQAQLVQQRTELWQDFQQASLQTLESMILQLPTAIYAAEQNPQVSATKLIPLLRPLERLLADWGMEAIAAVGAIVAYDPQVHHLLEGTATPGAAVKVRYTGYCQGEALRYRAKVSPVALPANSHSN
jgi:DNA-binding Xre family transcriptional regulator